MKLNSHYKWIFAVVFSFVVGIVSFEIMGNYIRTFDDTAETGSLITPDWVNLVNNTLKTCSAPTPVEDTPPPPTYSPGQEVFSMNHPQQMTPSCSGVLKSGSFTPAASGQFRIITQAVSIPSYHNFNPRLVMNGADVYQPYNFPCCNCSGCDAASLPPDSLRGCHCEGATFRVSSSSDAEVTIPLTAGTPYNFEFAYDNRACYENKQTNSGMSMRIIYVGP